MPNNKLLTNFIKARYAEWAGDFVYCHELLEDFSERGFLERESKQTKAIKSTQASRKEHYPRPSIHPLELIQKAGLRVKEYADELIGSEMEGPSLIITSHLRGVIWEVGTHEFELRAYLSDLSWEPMLYENAAFAARRFKGEIFFYEKNTNHPENEKGEHDDRAGEDMGNRVSGATWILDEGNFFREVVVSYLALVKVRGIWAKRELPNDNNVIITGFTQVLNLLEGQR